MVNPVVLSEPMRSRWSPSSFDPEHVLGDDELTALLEAARWAPSRGNTQPWVFVVLPRGGPGHDVLSDALSRGNAWVRAASAVVVTCVRTAPDPDAAASGGDDREVPADYACYDTGQAAAHLTLQARAMGLHAHQFSGVDLGALAAGLGVPDHFRALSGIAVGAHRPPAGVDEALAEREARPRARRGLDEAARFGNWRDGWSSR